MAEKVLRSIGVTNKALRDVLPPLRKNECAYITGSLISSLGTKHSDIDIVLVCDEDNLEEYIVKVMKIRNNMRVPKKSCHLSKRWI